MAQLERQLDGERTLLHFGFYDLISSSREILLQLHANMRSDHFPAYCGRENLQLSHSSCCVEVRDVSRDISLHHHGDEAPRAVLTDGPGQSHWLTSQKRVSHGWGETLMDCGWHCADGGVALRQRAALMAPLWGFRLQVLEQANSLPHPCCLTPISLLAPLCKGIKFPEKTVAVHFISAGSTVRRGGCESVVRAGDGFLWLQTQWFSGTI